MTRIGIKRVAIIPCLLAMSIVLTTFFTTIAVSDENVGGWLDFQLLMKKKDAEPIIRKMCFYVDDRGDDLTGENCHVKTGFFEGKEIDIRLQGRSSFFSSNAPIVVITIDTDYDEYLYNTLFNHLTARWKVSFRHKCTKPRPDGHKECGVAFNNNRIELTHWQSRLIGSERVKSMSLSYSSFEGVPPILD